MLVFFLAADLTLILLVKSVVSPPYTRSPKLRSKSSFIEILLIFPINGLSLITLFSLSSSVSSFLASILTDFLEVRLSRVSIVSLLTYLRFKSIEDLFKLLFGSLISSFYFSITSSLFFL